MSGRKGNGTLRRFQKEVDGLASSLPTAATVDDGGCAAASEAKPLSLHPPKKGKEPRSTRNAKVAEFRRVGALGVSTREGEGEEEKEGLPSESTWERKSLLSPLLDAVKATGA